MTKPQAKRTIILDAIAEAYAKHSTADARAILSERTGASLTITATVEKVIRRDGGLKLLLKPVNSTYQAFAEFNDEGERIKVKEQKIRKGSKVSVTGDFRTAGYCALTMNNTRLIY